MDLDAKDPDVAATYTIDWHDELVIEAFREYSFAAGVFVQAQRDTGWYYECTTAGRTARNYPQQWPRAAGETVNDGSVVWTARHPSSSTVPLVSSATWTVPAGLTLDSQSESGALTSIVVSGGTDGVDYDVLCRMTPTSGSIAEKTITIPVRAQ
jgi:hypothetical protein